MSATMRCPKCKTVTKGELAGKVGFSGPAGGPLATPTLDHASLMAWYPNRVQWRVI